MDSEILHKEGRGLCFSDVPMERLLMSMKSHLVDRENQENEDPSGLDSELPTKSNGVSGSSRSMHSNGIGLGINRYDNAPVSICKHINECSFQCAARTSSILPHTLHRLTLVTDKCSSDLMCGTMHLSWALPQRLFPRSV